MASFFVAANLASGKEKASTLFAPQLVEIDICCSRRNVESQDY